MAQISQWWDARPWRKLYQAISRPSILPEELDAKLRELHQRLPLPVFWLLGKAQSGKTSLVRALTGSSTAEIGNGFRPCTRSARFYDFPDPQTAFVRFLDTRGLGEVAYDPAEDMGWCERHAHLLIVTMKAMDHQQKAVLSAIRRIHRSHPQWPILVVQTVLHEGYRAREASHVQPYPYASVPFPVSVPTDLVRSLLKQRELFHGLPAHFVAVDFTLPEEGYSPADYGVDALWDALEETLPVGVAAMLRNLEQSRLLQDLPARKAHGHIVGYAVSAGLAGAIPVPAASMATVLAIQTKLFHSIAALYGVPVKRRMLAEIGSAVGLGYLAGMGGRELVKLIPGYGQTAGAGVAGLYSAAVTYGLGKTFCAYFALTRRGAAFDGEVLRDIYRAEFARGRELLRRSVVKEEV